MKTHNRDVISGEEHLSVNSQESDIPRELERSFDVKRDISNIAKRAKDYAAGALAELADQGTLIKNESLRDFARDCMAAVIQQYKRTMRITLGFSVLVGALASEPHYAWGSGEQVERAAIAKSIEASPVPRYEVKRHTDETGRIQYEHTNAETTAALNYPSGKGDLPDDLKLKMLQEILAERAELYPNDKAYMPSNFEELSLPALEAVFAKMTRALKRELTPEEIAHEVQFLYESEYPKHPYDPLVEKALWELEEECGAPAIQLYVNQPTVEAVRTGKPAVQNVKEYQAYLDHHRSHYNMNTNTVRIEIAVQTLGLHGAPRRDVEQSLLLSELSHSIQNNFDTVDARIKNRRDGLLAEAVAKAEGISVQEAYDKAAYSNKRGLEHEAHTGFQPLLTKQFSQKKGSSSK